MPSVINRIKAYNKDIPAEQIELKWAALRESPFRFYRGTCHLFAEDMDALYKGDKKLKVWLCGDLHFENFGSYKGQNRLVYFDINDFDESVLAIPEIDVARFLTSIVIAGRQMHAKEKQVKDVLKQLMQAYCDTLRAGKALMMEQEVAHGSLKKYFEQLQKRNRNAFVAKRTVKDKHGRLTIKTDGLSYKPLIDKEIKESLRHSLLQLFKGIEHFSVLDIKDTACRIAGTGSLGLQRYVALCYNTKKDKYYFLDVKEARRSCYSQTIKVKQPHFANEAARIIYAEWIMQFCAPGYTERLKMGKKWFVVKELQPSIDKISLESFDSNFALLAAAAIDMVPLMAYAHIRSSGHMGASNADELVRFANKKKWQKEILDLAPILADKNTTYYNAFAGKK